MIKTYYNHSLLPHNTFGLNIKAARFIEYETVNDLKTLLVEGSVSSPFLHIGQGSNLLFKGDYEGIILHSRIATIEKMEETEDAVFLKVGSGVVWDDFVAFCVQNNWYGAENLSDIPGEVGASAVQNIGAYGVEVKDLIVSVSTINIKGEEKEYKASECDFSYRHSIFKKPEMREVFVTSVSYRLSKKASFTLDYGTIKEEIKKYPEVTLQAVRDTVMSIRSSKLPDPKVQGNAGSFFMNPIVSVAKYEELNKLYPGIPHYKVDDNRIKIPAGWLIDQAGWKGKTFGGAAVHDKQALVLVNRGGATAEEIVALSEQVQKDIKNKFGIEINPEVRMV